MSQCHMGTYGKWRFAGRGEMDGVTVAGPSADPGPFDRSGGGGRHIAFPQTSLSSSRWRIRAHPDTAKYGIPPEILPCDG